MVPVPGVAKFSVLIQKVVLIFIRFNPDSSLHQGQKLEKAETLNGQCGFGLGGQMPTVHGNVQNPIKHVVRLL